MIPKVFVAISGVGIYPPSESAKYDENSNVKGYDFLSNMCHDWENAANVDANKPCRVVNFYFCIKFRNLAVMIFYLFCRFQYVAVLFWEEMEE